MENETRTSAVHDSHWRGSPSLLRTAGTMPCTRHQHSTANTTQNPGRLMPAPVRFWLGDQIRPSERASGLPGVGTASFFTSGIGIASAALSTGIMFVLEPIRERRSLSGLTGPASLLMRIAHFTRATALDDRRLGRWP